MPKTLSQYMAEAAARRDAEERRLSTKNAVGHSSKEWDAYEEARKARRSQTCACHQ